VVARWNQLDARASGAGPTINHIMDMKTETLSYHEARAEEELRRAERATTTGAVRAHVALAEMHLDIVYREDPPAESDKSGCQQSGRSPPAP